MFASKLVKKISIKTLLFNYFKVIKTNFKILTIILIVIMLFANIALAAAPGIPNAFYGIVTWNGQPAPDGTSVVAKINGVQVASTTTSGGKYGYPIGSFYIEDPNGDRPGKIINFFVNNVDTGQTAIFNTGGVTQLNLVASGGTTPSGPSGGGGGGGLPLVTTTQTNNQTATQTTQQGCQERWVCSDWSACQNGIQTRTCSDENNCGTNNKEPFTSQPCSAAERKQAEQTNTLLPTGFFLGLSTSDWLMAIVAGIVIAAVIIFLVKKKSLKKK
jgi:hypothetical protein